MVTQIRTKAFVQIGPGLPWRNRLLVWLLRAACRILFRVRVVGLENVPAGACIVVANHLSWIDHLLLMAILPAEPRLYLVGASQSICSPFKNWLVATFGSVIPVERGADWVGKDVLSRPVQVLESGAKLLLFPEGNVGQEEGELLPLKHGIGHYALRADCPILPVALSGVKELYWQKQMKVIIGQPFRVRIQGLDRHAAMGAAVDQVEAALRGLLPRYQEPVVAAKRLRFLTTISDRV